MSDLHLEHSEIFELQAKANLDTGDVLVLAGDICPIKKIDTRVYFPKVLEHAHKNYKHIIAIAGNHEFYGSSINEVDKLREFYSKHGVTFLENEHIEIGGLDFYGGTAWTDMGGNDPEVHKRVKNYMNDFWIIKDFSTEKAYEIHQEFLKNMGEPDVLITHHGTHYQCVDPRYANEGLANYGYFSNMDVPKSVQIRINGHVHWYYKQFLGDGSIITANPRGYPGEKCYKEFKFNRFVEIHTEAEDH